MATWYDILEVSPNASKEVIEMAYKALAKQHHPDLNPIETREQCEENMKILNAAREVLSNDENRKRYDIELYNYYNNISVEQNVSQNINTQYYKPNMFKRIIIWMSDHGLVKLVSFIIAIVLINLVIGWIQDVYHSGDTKELNTMKESLNNDKSIIDKMEGQLKIQYQQYIDLKDRVNENSAQREIDDFNNLVDTYNYNLDLYDSKIKDYNTKVNEYNDLAEKAGTRYYILPIPSSK